MTPVFGQHAPHQKGPKSIGTEDKVIVLAEQSIFRATQVT